MNDMTTQNESNNVFAGTAIAQRATNNALADAGQQREIAEVQAAMVIAKRFPRNEIEAMDRIINACTRKSLAETALYSYARGGSEITGPSIRLAEVAAQAWGNINFGIRELEQRNGESTVEAYAWDVESNTRQVKVFQVKHERHTRSGSKKLEDPRDVYELVANQGARRLRACILGVIPGDVIEAAVKQCEHTMKANADTSPEGLQKLVDAFEPFGVSRTQIEKRIQCRLEAIRPAQVVQLKKVYASLRDGMSEPADWFEVDAAAQAPAGAAKPALRDKVAAAAKKATPAASEAPAGTDTATGETPATVLKTTKQIRAALHDATSRDEVMALGAAISQIPDDTERAECEELYDARLVALA